MGGGVHRMNIQSYLFGSVQFINTTRLSLVKVAIYTLLDNSEIPSCGLIYTHPIRLTKQKSLIFLSSIGVEEHLD